MNSPSDSPIAVVCGASSGIGYAAAAALARDGYRLVISSRNPGAAAERLQREHGAEVEAVAADLADAATAAALCAAAERLGGLDALLLNHGGPPVKPFLDAADEDWDAYFRLIVQGPLRLLRHAVPLFRRRGGGRVVGISSFMVKTPFPGMVLSQSLRAAFVNALKTAAIELGPEGVLINAVAPGYIRTERLLGFNEIVAARRNVSADEIAARATSGIPLRRYGTPEEIAELIVWLLSPKNGYVSGQHLLVDGGLVTAG